MYIGVITSEVLDYYTGDVLQKLLNDPLYTGLRQMRIKGAEYQQFVDEFVHAVVNQYVTGI